MTLIFYLKKPCDKEFKIGKKYQISSRLLSCLKFRLGPVDAATLTWLRIEVLDSAATSQINVTNRLLFEEFEAWFKLDR